MEIYLCRSHSTCVATFAGHAHEPEESKTIFKHAIPHGEGKRLVAQAVTYPPSGKTPSRRHAKSSFIYAHVLSGAIRSQVDDESVKVYHVGEGFYEVPGSMNTYNRMAISFSRPPAAAK